MISLIATKPYPYAAKSLQKGDVFDAPLEDAMLLKRLNLAIDAPAHAQYDTKVIEPPVPGESQDVASPSKRRRTYKRRDLVPEG